MRRSLAALAIAFTAAAAASASLPESRPGASSGKVPPRSRPEGRQALVEREAEEMDLTRTDMVAFSSRLIAAARAMESRRTDRLFDDRFAEALAGTDAMETYEERLQAAVDAHSATPADGHGHAETLPEESSRSRRLAIRTRFCDDFFEDCTLSRGIKQIVSVGAGMDTRGLRLRASPGTTVFEVDQAVVLRVKRRILEETQTITGREDGKSRGEATVVEVEADLSQTGWEGELFEAGFDPASPSAWILEGLTMYLEETELVSLLEVIARLCVPGSAFCATCVSEESVKRAKGTGSELMGTWKWGCDDPQAFFEDKFPSKWSFKGVTCGDPGGFPDGADYSVGFAGKGPAYVFGYLSAKDAAQASGGQEDRHEL